MHRIPLASTDTAAQLQLPAPLFIVLGVMDDREIRGVTEYLINWEGPYDHSWHTQTDLSNDDLIAKYKASKAKRAKQAKKRARHH